MSLAALSHPTLCDPMDCSPSGSFVHGILQARIVEWVAMPSSRGSSQPRDQTHVSSIAGRFFIIWATREAPKVFGLCRIITIAIITLPTMGPGTLNVFSNYHTTVSRNWGSKVMHKQQRRGKSEFQTLVAAIKTHIHSTKLWCPYYKKLWSPETLSSGYSFCTCLNKITGDLKTQAKRTRKMSDRLIDKGNKRTDKNTSDFECHPDLCLPKGGKKLQNNHDFHFELCLQCSFNTSKN